MCHCYRYLRLLFKGGSAGLLMPFKGLTVPNAILYLDSNSTHVSEYLYFLFQVSSRESTDE